ncbi:hypothetical protein ONZ45_g19682 [Pleurotus djamor]|nr:hypothetical protein ONZ45_g19682 [Pleurotus djamor]
MSRNHPPTISTQHEADKLDVSYPYLDFGGSVLGTEMLHFVSTLALALPTLGTTLCDTRSRIYPNLTRRAILPPAGLKRALSVGVDAGFRIRLEISLETMMVALRLSLPLVSRNQDHIPSSLRWSGKGRVWWFRA